MSDDLALGVRCDRLLTRRGKVQVAVLAGETSRQMNDLTGMAAALVDQRIPKTSSEALTVAVDLRSLARAAAHHPPQDLDS